MRAHLDRKVFLRVVDANFNRAKEGLRVCEDTARFVRNSKGLARDYKDVRHKLTDAVSGFGFQALLAARDIHGDVGRVTTDSESARVSVNDIFQANSQRVKESLRVLEEFAKLVDIAAAENLKLLRYRVYALEKTALVGSQVISYSGCRGAGQRALVASNKSGH